MVLKLNLGRWIFLGCNDFEDLFDADLHAQCKTMPQFCDRSLVFIEPVDEPEPAA
jgi:hypothetical protein